MRDELTAFAVEAIFKDPDAVLPDNFWAAYSKVEPEARVKIQELRNAAIKGNADDIVDAEQIRMFQETGKGITVPTSYDMGGVDLRDLTVEGPDGPTTAYDRLREIGIQPEGADNPMKEAVADVIRSETYQMAPDGKERGTKLWMLQEVISKYRDAATKQLLREYPQEVGEPTSARAKEVREAYRQAQSGGMAPATGSQVQELLAGYGIK